MLLDVLQKITGLALGYRNSVMQVILSYLINLQISKVRCINDWRAQSILQIV